MAFFNKQTGKEKLKLEGKESVVSSKDILPDANSSIEDVDEDELIQTDLSIHPDWNIPKEDIYAYQFLNMECEPLNPNQISLSGISLRKEEDHYRVTAFIRNSSGENIRFNNDSTIILLNDQEQLLASKKFDLAEIGEIPARSSRPWHFIFSNEDLFTNNLPSHDWKLAFLLESNSRKHSLDLDESWETSLSDEEKRNLVETFNSLTPLKPGEINFVGIQAIFAKNGDFYVTLFIRNGSDNKIEIQGIPLQVEDADGDIVAVASFKLDNFTVKENSSKPWTFIFPKALVKKEQPNLTKWLVYPPKN